MKKRTLEKLDLVGVGARLERAGIKTYMISGLIEPLVRLRKKQERLALALCNEDLGEERINREERIINAMMEKIKAMAEKEGLKLEIELNNDPRGGVIMAWISKNEEKVLLNPLIW